MSSTYAAPKPRKWRSFPLSPLLPADPPPSNLLNAPPTLPTYKAPSEFGNGYTRSTHIFPAAWPRRAPYVPTPPYAYATEGEGRDAKKARVKKVAQELVDLGTQYEEGKLDGVAGSDKVLWVCANRYARTNRGSGTTLICLHANGMHKELFEPLLNRVFALRDDVDEVWALDAVQHGDSALLNEADDSLGILFSWSDGTRDLLCFLQHYLPSEACSQLPTVLERIPSELAHSRLKNGFSKREIVGIGHSFGGCLLTLAARVAPFLLDAIVLVDPLIVPRELGSSALKFFRAFLSGAVGRRNSWSSREDAFKAFKASPLGAWPDEVLRLYVEHGLAENSSGGVRLKCTGLQEAVVFVEGHSAHQAWTALPDIDERVAIHWILPPTSESMVMVEEVAAERVHRRTANASHIVLGEGTHLLVQSHPADVSRELNKFLQDWRGRSQGRVQSKARL